MASSYLRRKIAPPLFTAASTRTKTSSAAYVASRVLDPSFEKLMYHYQNLHKVTQVRELILSNPISLTSPHSASVSVDFLHRLSQKLHFDRGAHYFLLKYPHIFDIFYHPAKHEPHCRLTPTAIQVASQEAAAINASLPLVVDRLVRVLSMSSTKTVPLRAIFKVYRELGLPDDFEDSVIARNSDVFGLMDGYEINTHLLKLVKNVSRESLVAAVEDWRLMKYCSDDCSLNRSEFQYCFEHGFPPGLKLTKNFKTKVREWQKMAYIGPYDEEAINRNTKAGRKQLQKRAVAMVHEFLSLTVEKMAEVEKISHFRKWFGIDMNMRDLFLDHPGMFYLSTKGHRHTVFLREAYQRGRLIEPNPVYEARRKLLHLVMMGHRGLIKDDAGSKSGEISVGNKENDQRDMDGSEEVESDLEC